jgi:acetyl esterase/lipase
LDHLEQNLGAIGIPTRGSSNRNRSVQAATAVVALMMLSTPIVAAETRLGVVYGDSEATLDFFAAHPTADAPGLAPLLAFVEGRYWGVEDSGGFPLRSLVAAPLRAEGVSVALIRHRPAPAHTHPVFAQDVAAAVAWLVTHAAELGVDRRRIFLAGHASGGYVAALVALDPRYLAAHDLGTDVLAGVVPISAVYDLETTGDGPEELHRFYRQAFPSAVIRHDASLARHIRKDAPPFTVLAAQNEIPGFREAASAFGESLRAAGHPEAETFIAVGRDHRSVLEMGSDRNAAREHLLGFIGVGESAAIFRDTLSARRYWRNPGLSTEPFWQIDGVVEDRQGDAALMSWLRRFFTAGGRPAMQLVESRYDAIDLFALLRALGSERVGSGRWLVLTNTRGERAVLELEALRPYAPQVVIGLDGERNLFRVADLYHTKRRYSWRDRDAESWVMARPVGAFLHFSKAPPAEIVPGIFGFFGLTPDSFRLTDQDPLAPLRTELSQEDRDFLIREKACVSCHQLRGVGGRAGHIRARDGELVAGFALPLEEYPPEVWRRYCFEQADVAAEVGADEVHLSPEWQQRLFDLVVRERDSEAAAQ